MYQLVARVFANVPEDLTDVHTYAVRRCTVRTYLRVLHEASKHADLLWVSGTLGLIQTLIDAYDVVES